MIYDIFKILALAVCGLCFWICEDALEDQIQLLYWNHFVRNNKEFSIHGKVLQFYEDYIIMQFSKNQFDIKSVIDTLYSSTEFQLKLEEKLNNFIRKNGLQNTHQQTISPSSRQSEKLISDISGVIQTIIKSSLQQAMENQHKIFKQELIKIKEQFKNQMIGMDSLKKKIDKQPINFSQQNQHQTDYRNRFQIMRKPANLIVSGGGGSTTYTTSPTYQSSKTQDSAKDQFSKLKQDIQVLRKQMTNEGVTLASELKQMNSRLQKNNERIRMQLQSIVKNSDTRFQYVQQNMKKHMERSLQSLWKMITSIKSQVQEINSELHLNQSGIMISDI